MLAMRQTALNLFALGRLKPDHLYSPEITPKIPPEFMSSSADFLRSSSIFEVFNFPIKATPDFSASSKLLFILLFSIPPLSAIAPLKRPLARGDATRAQTLIEPAD